VYYTGRSNVRLSPKSDLFVTFMYTLYRPMLVRHMGSFHFAQQCKASIHLAYIQVSTTSIDEAWSIPVNNLVDLGMVVYMYVLRSWILCVRARWPTSPCLMFAYR
jgi:hypothetical protein